MYEISGSTRAVALYPLSKTKAGGDISITRNADARSKNVRYVEGPDGVPASATYFFGRKNSYITFPNGGALDTKYAITIIAWIRMEGRSEPIFNYKYAVIYILLEISFKYYQD